MYNQKKICCLVFIIKLGLISAAFNSAVSAQDLEWVTVEGSASLEHFSKEEARIHAIKEAEHIAVNEVVGASISAESLAVNLKLSGGMVGSIPYGVVNEKKIIEESIVNVYSDGKIKPEKIYKVKVQAGVMKKATDSGSFFNVDAALDRFNYKDGDEMTLSVTPSSDCFIAVFVIMEDDKVLRLIPNSFKESSIVQAFETFTFPSEGDRQKGIRLKAHVAKDQNTSSEILYVLALKKPIQFSSAIQQGMYGLYKGKTAFINNLIKEVVNIPMNKRAEQMIPYQITK